jgi:hypothetical protein
VCRLFKNFKIPFLNLFYKCDPDKLMISLNLTDNSQDYFIPSTRINISIIYKQIIICNSLVSVKKSVSDCELRLT